MLARDEDTGQALSGVQLRDHVITFIGACHETTAVALTWAFYLLARHPDAERRVREEVEQVLSGRTPTAIDVPKLRCTRQAIEESMRLYPPVYGVGREAVRDSEIHGYRVPKGTTIFISQWVIHRDPRFYPEPQAFRPERWLGEAARSLPKFAYLPFGGGPRLCIGNTFAMMEAVLILATLIGRFRFELEPGEPVVPFPAITLRPRGGIRMRLWERRAARAEDAPRAAS
jgi:cytochrome P450